MTNVMKTRLEPVFQAYERLAAQTDALFEKVASQYPQCVKCAPGCDDCCHALFDLSLVEAMHVNIAFGKKFGHGQERSRILEEASRTDRALTKFKRELYRKEKEGAGADVILDKASAMRMPCPLLDKEHRCALYDSRPITCRLYGIPLDIGGKSHVCGLSSFEKGHDYPAVRVARIQETLERLSREIGSVIGSRYEFGDLYIPLSMALLTKFDDAWLGIGKPTEDD